MGIAHRDGTTMNAASARRCVIALMLLGVGVATPASPPVSIIHASNGSSEARKPATAGGATPDGTTRGTVPAAKTRPAPTPPSRAQEVEQRVRSGQMEPPVAQGDISERLNQLESGLSSLSDETGTDQTGTRHSPR
jgi:hypothetical protein